MNPPGEVPVVSRVDGTQLLRQNHREQDCYPTERLVAGLLRQVPPRIASLDLAIYTRLPNTWVVHFTDRTTVSQHKADLCNRLGLQKNI